jgi:hypothetical protein
MDIYRENIRSVRSVMKNDLLKNGGIPPEPRKENIMYPEMTNQNPLEIKLADDERQPCEVWTRVMGYHRPTSSFNIGKQSEHSERKYFVETGTPDTGVSRPVH